MLSCCDVHVMKKVAAPTFAIQVTATLTVFQSIAHILVHHVNLGHKESLYALFVEGKSVIGLLLSLHASS